MTISKWHYSMLVLTWLGLWALALGAFTSMTFLALVHVFLILPCLYFFICSKKWEFTPSMWGLLALILIFMASVFHSWELIEDPFKNLSRVKYFVVGLLSVFAFRAVFAEYVTEKKTKWIARFALIAVSVATVSGLIGIWTGYNPLRFEEVHSHRNGGLFSMLMTYAYGLSLLMVILTGLALYGRDVIQKYMSLKWFYLAYVINLIGLYCTYTRGAWLGFIVGVPFLFFRENKKLFLAVFGGLAVLGATLVMTVPDIRDGISRGSSDALRIAFFQTAVKAFEERPILGYGYRNFESHVVDIKSRNPHIGFPEHGGHAHNNFLELLASTGALGALAFVFFTLAWAWEMYRRDDLMGRVTFAFIMSFSASGLFQFTWGDGPITFFLMALYPLSLIGARRLLA